LQQIKILATGSFLPETVVANDDFKRIVDTSDEWISTRTGISTRHFSSEPTWRMGAKAAKAALEQGKIDPEEIDLIIGTTITNDYATPSMACLVQGAVGAKNARAFDIGAACSGFVYALDLASRLLADGEIRKVMVVSAERLSKITDFSRRESCVLFGDGAAACIVEKGDSPVYSYLKSDGTQGGMLYAHNPDREANPFVPEFSLEGEFPEPESHAVQMDGKEVYKFSTRAMPEAVSEVCRKAGISPEELDWIIPHQANIRIMATAAKALGVSMERIAANISRAGNTSSASIPICMDEMNRTGRLLPGQWVCLVGFGAGATYGAVLLRW
jgi:3-oxoacyl-[acyl-carrier-protein] synthase-3